MSDAMGFRFQDLFLLMHLRFQIVLDLFIHELSRQPLMRFQYPIFRLQILQFSFRLLMLLYILLSLLACVDDIVCSFLFVCLDLGIQTVYSLEENLSVLL